MLKSHRKPIYPLVMKLLFTSYSLEDLNHTLPPPTPEPQGVGNHLVVIHKVPCLCLSIEREGVAKLLNVGRLMQDTISKYSTSCFLCLDILLCIYIYIFFNMIKDQKAADAGNRHDHYGRQVVLICMCHP